MGRNGIGKTTLMEAIMGLLPTCSGTMEYQGTDLARLAADMRTGFGVGYVPQGRQIFPILTVKENLHIGLAARTDGKQRLPKLAFQVIPRVAGNARPTRRRPLRWSATDCHRLRPGDGALSC